MDHFIVYYSDDESMAREIGQKADSYYNKIASDLGYARYSNFWQWDKRVKIYIHSSAEAFRKAANQPAWSHGLARYEDKTIHAYDTDQNFLETILPHEITHLVFRDFVGIEGQIPLWMDEGVAQWEETGKREAAKKIVRELVLHDNVMDVGTLTSTEIRGEKDEQKVGLFYIQAVSLVDFLISKYGSASFTEFCRGLRDGKSVEQALKSAYGRSIEGIQDLDKKWKDYALQS